MKLTELHKRLDLCLRRWFH